MKLDSSFSDLRGEEEAVATLLSGFSEGKLPSLLICYYTQDYSSSDLSKAFVQAAPGVPVLGCSTFRGLLTNHGFHTGPVLGGLAFYDAHPSAFSTGFADFSCYPDIEQATCHALNSALQKAGRTGEQPDLILLHCSSGYEERVLQVIQDEFGTHVPLLGSTAADNCITGEWSLFTEEGTFTDGVSLALIYAATPVCLGYNNGYSASQISGIVTKCTRREILEIDHQPAVEVYDQWVKSLTGEQCAAEDLFKSSNAVPFGRARPSSSKHRQYDLIHPVRQGKGGGIETFATIQEGETLHLMAGSRERLFTRAERVTQSARDNATFNHQVIGAIGSFCAGSMLNLGEDLNEVAKRFSKALNYAPFICPFSFGEQGSFDLISNSHSNLMVSAAVFYEDPDV